MESVLNENCFCKVFWLEDFPDYLTVFVYDLSVRE